MTTPLYKDHRAPELLPRSAHAGLWFDKFCNQWQRNPEQSGLKSWSLKSFTERRGKDRVEVNPKLDWIRTLTGSPVGNEKLLDEYTKQSDSTKQDEIQQVGNEKLLDEYTKRLGSMVPALGGCKLYLKTASRFATGLGREHPIENGFAWHPTLGAPYLPGSSVKGFVRAWARVLLENGNVDAATERRIFGGERSEHVGSVIFFDAIPIKPVQLEADVMTPHYGPYYQGKKDDNGQPHPPADWHSPKPIPFLTVSSGQSFLFGIAPRTSSDADRQDCEKVAQWLPEALQTLGAGAKAAVGYGRFVPDPESAEAAKKADEEAAKKAQEAAEQAAFVASLANLSPIARELRQAAHAGRWETDANAFKSAGVREKWMERLEADPQPDAVAYFGELIEKHDPGILANPDRKKGKKQESAYKESSIKITKRWLALPKQ